MPVQRGENYLVNLNPVRGREQAGSRPVLVISTDDEPTDRPCEADLTKNPVPNVKSCFHFRQ